MIIAISRIMFRPGHVDKVLPLLKENMLLGANHKGCIESHFAQCTDRKNEILVYTLWLTQEDYDNAKKSIKKDPRSTKLMFKLLPHLAQEPSIDTYDILQFSG